MAGFGLPLCILVDVRDTRPNGIMPNAFASLVLFSWPLVTLVLLRTLPRGRALIACILVGYLFLPPPPAGIDLPVLPPLTKETIPNLSLAFLCAMMWRRDLEFWPESRLVQVLIGVFILSPFATVMTNTEPVYYGQVGLPGLQIKEALSLMSQQAMLIVPFLLARAVLTTADDQRDLVWALAIGGLVYSVPMLLEVRLSPQLNIWIYGYFQHNFDQMIRFGGFRPIVFLYHGIWVAFFCMTAVLAAFALMRNEAGSKKLILTGAAIYLFGVLFLAKTLGALVYAVALVPLVLLFGRKTQLLAAVLMAGLAIGYPLLKGADLVPKEGLLSAAAMVDEDRANSLRFRFDQETILMERAYEKPLFGWGIWGRNHILDENTGQILTVTDGRWIIRIGMFGWLGFLAEFLLLATPIFILWRRSLRADSPSLSPYAITLALMLGVNMVDLIPNATITPLTWLFAGAVLGYAERYQPSRTSRPVVLQTVL